MKQKSDLKVIIERDKEKVPSLTNLDFEAIVFVCSSKRVSVEELWMVKFQHCQKEETEQIWDQSLRLKNVVFFFMGKKIIGRVKMMGEEFSQNKKHNQIG